MKKFYLLLLSLCSVYCWAQNSITGYEYWFNNSHQNRTVQYQTETNLNLSIATTSLGKGIHSFHIQVFDDSSKYSSPLSKYFFKVHESSFENREISAYRYWFNNDMNTAQTTAVDMQAIKEIVAEIDVNTLPDGINNISLQVKDNADQWSATIKQNFLKTNGNYIGKYQYWFNADMENAVTSDFIPSENSLVEIEIDATMLSDGMNMLNIRYLDKLGKSSSTLSQFFFKTPKSTSEANNIANYQYWIDDEIENANTFTFDANDNELFLTGIDLANIPNGFHTLYIRFSDDKGLWSQTINKFFTKSNINESGSNGIAGFQYWFNDDFASAMQLTIENSPVFVDYEQTIDFNSQDRGEVYLNYRFFDENKMWSVVNTELITNNKTPTSTSELFTKGIKLYPNPVVDYLMVEFSSGFENTALEILDLNGRVVYTQSCNGNKERIDLNGLNSGLYLLKIKNSTENQTFKFIKK